MEDNKFTIHIVWAVVASAAIIVTGLLTQFSTSRAISQKMTSIFKEEAVAHHAAHYEVSDKGVVSFVWNDESKK